MSKKISNFKFQILNSLFCLLLTIPCLLLTLSLAFSETREFTLTVTDGEIELNGVKFMVWKYNNQFPGPEIRVKEGDVVKFKLRNKSSVKHGLFFHGLHVNPGTAIQEQEIFVDPGYEYTYGEFIAKPAGTHLYHCSWNMAEHLSRGLYGAFIVEGKPVPAGSKQGDEPKVDNEFVYIISDWNSKAEKGDDSHGAGHPRTMLDYDITTINDRVLSSDNPTVIKAKKGERIRIRLGNIGMLPHKLRFSDGFLVTHEDGYVISSPQIHDELTIYPGKRYDIIITAKDTGRWPVYHKVEMPRPFGYDEKAHDSEHGSHGVKEEDLKRKEDIALVLEVEG